MPRHGVPPRASILELRLDACLAATIFTARLRQSSMNFADRPTLRAADFNVRAHAADFTCKIGHGQKPMMASSAICSRLMRATTMYDFATLLRSCQHGPI